MSRYHIITPLARVNFFTQVRDMLQKQIIESKLSITWDIIIDLDSTIDLGNLENFSWIKIHKCPNEGVEFWKRCNNSINWYLDNHLLDFEAKYLFLNDDDFYEPSFFIKINKSESPIIICSMKRGSNTPFTSDPFKRHPTYDLIAAPQNMKVGGVGIEQIIIKGSYLKKYKLPIHVWGDGMMIEHIIKTNKEIEYLPEAYVLFNYLEEGRWQK